MQVLDISEKSRILILAPHPDDECIGCGGVLLKYANNCDIIVLTDGRQGQGDESPDKVKEIRKKEFIDEMHAIGVKSYKIIDIEDGTLLLHTDCLSKVRFNDYDFLFVTGINDDHPDHKAAFLSVEQAVKKYVGNPVPRCFVYEVHTPLLNPTHFLDITDSISEKTDLIKYHKSQLKELPYDILAEQCASYRATLYRMPLKKIEVYEEVNLTNSLDQSVSETEYLLQKERVIGWTLKRWVLRLLNDVPLASSLYKHTNKEIYIYGYGELGKLLIKELKKERIIVKAVIDRRAEQFKNEEINIVRLEDVIDRLPIIVTAIYDFPMINKQLQDFGFEEIYSLRTLLEEDNENEVLVDDNK